MAAEIQSILFYKGLWTVCESRQWLFNHHRYPIKPPHSTNKFIKYCLQKPDDYSRFKSVIHEDGILFIIGFK